MQDNVSTNIISLLIMLSISGVIRSQRKNGSAGRLYYYIGLLTLFELFIEIVASISFDKAWLVTQIILVIYYTTNPLIGALWIIYIYMVIVPKYGKREKRIAPWLITPYYLYAIVGLSNPFTHVFFSLTKDMEYIRHDEIYHLLSISTFALLSIVGIVILTKYYKQMKDKSLAGIILSYVLLIGGAIWAQASIQGWLMLNAALTVVYVISYFAIQNKRVLDLSKSLEESEKTKKDALTRAMAEERFRLVARDSNDIVFEINLVSCSVVANENYYKTFGETAAFDLLWEEKIVHPDDREKFLEVKRRMVRAEKGVPLELRLKTKTGEYKWFMLVISAFTDDEGRITRVMGKYSDIDSRTHEKQLLEHRAQTDPATGLYNKITTEQLMTLALQEGKTSAILIADIDDLKLINDSLGHAEGDRAISLIAETFKMQFRSTDIIGRIGGDEFLVMLDGVSEEAKLKNMLASLIYKISCLRVGENNNYPVRCSMGVVIAGEGDSFDRLYANADKALYFVKRGNKNTFAIYTPEMENSNYEFKGGRGGIRTTLRIGAQETELLMESLTVLYPLIISANIERNSYIMLEHNNYGISFGEEMGAANELLNAILDASHPAERDEIRNIFSLHSIERSFEEGERTIVYQGRQRLSSGLFRWAKIIAVLSENQEKELCTIIFMRPVTDKNAL